MDIYSKNELEITKSKIIKTQVLSAPGTILFVLGLYALFVGKGNAFLPILNDRTFVVYMLIFGSVIQIWQLFTLVPLFRKISKMSRKANVWK